MTSHARKRSGSIGESRGKGEVMKLDRRDFLKSAALVGGVGAAIGMVGCSPQGQGQEDKAPAADPAREAFEAAAQPIAPADVPATWDEEREIIVVGSGAGGMNASIRLAQAGYDVLMVERNPETGGNSKHSSVFSNFGGHKQAEEAQ